MRGLETTATYDAQSGEFVLHSPTPSSTKWWPGGLGKTATHAVVMARLMLPDGRGGVKDHGPHAFVAQLRCLETHRPLPGVVVGDIGPKFGFNGVDNGFLRLDHVRIREPSCMLIHACVSLRYTPSLWGSSCGQMGVRGMWKAGGWATHTGSWAHTGMHLFEHTSTHSDSSHAKPPPPHTHT